MRPPTGLPPARAAAYIILDKALPLADVRRGVDIQAAIDQTLPSVPDARDKALATELAYGYCRRLGFVRQALDRFLDKPKALPPVARRLLELAVQELLFADSIPAYATVNWTVEALKNGFGASLAGLANAVLRRMDRERDVLFPEDRGHNLPITAERLSNTFALPLWLAKRWVGEYGPAKAAELARSQWRPAPVGIRVNAARPDAGELAQQLAASDLTVWSQGMGIAMPVSAFGEELAELERAGRLSRQSAAGQWLLTRLDAPLWPRPVWDACAGRGGKSMYLAEQGGGPIVASDTNLRRLRGCAKERARLGLNDVFVCAANGQKAPFGQQFGTVLLDAPCSGLGVLSKRPDAKWKRAPEDVRNLAQIQAGLLDEGWQCVRPGGILVYMTCTAMAAENEEQMTNFRSRHPEAVLVKQMDTIKAGLGEYFFAAIHQKPEDAC